MSETNNPRGRPKGSVNKLTQALQEMLDAEPGIHPAVILKRVANDTANEVNIRVQAATALLPYMAPKLKQVEITGQDGGPLEVTSVRIKTKLPPKPDWNLNKEADPEGDDDDA